MPNQDHQGGLSSALAAERHLHRQAVLLLVILLIGHLGTAPALGISSLSFVQKWGTIGSGNGQFHEPGGLAVGPNGNLYVADRRNHRIQVFTNNGDFVTAWGDSGTGNGQFDSPRDVAIDANGEVYVTDYFNNRIQVFSSTGTYLRQWGTTGIADGQFKAPRGIDVDRNFRVFVSEDGLPNKRVQKFTSTGGFLAKWGTVGSGDGEFQSPRSLTTNDSGQVYVSDSINNRVQKFTDNGTFLLLWGTAGSGNGQFQFTGGVAYLDGRVFVLDTNNQRLQIFDPAGGFLETTGSTCNIATGAGCVDPDGPGGLAIGDGQFLFPLGIAVEADGDVFIADSQNHRIQKFARTRTSSTGPAFAVLSGLSVSPNPTRSSAWVHLGIAGTGLATSSTYRVSARLYDGAGRLVRELFAGEMPAGTHALGWDGTRLDGSSAPPGVYFVDVRVDDSPARSVKLVRLR